MIRKCRFVGGPADGNVMTLDEVKRRVKILPLPDKNDKTPVYHYKRIGRDDDRTWVFEYVSGEGVA